MMALPSWSLAPWVPMWQKDLPRILRLAQLQPTETFYDLGCGNGKTVLYVAEHCSGQAIGVELAWPLWLVCKFRQWRSGRTNVQFYWRNLFRINLATADVVYVFGMPEKLRHTLRLKLERELKPGSRVISYVFPIVGWQPTIVDKPGQQAITIFLYQR